MGLYHIRNDFSHTPFPYYSSVKNRKSILLIPSVPEFNVAFQHGIYRMLLTKIILNPLLFTCTPMQTSYSWRSAEQSSAEKGKGDRKDCIKKERHTIMTEEKISLKILSANGNINFRLSHFLPQNFKMLITVKPFLTPEKLPFFLKPSKSQP